MHLHHEFSPPAMVLVIHLLQTLNHPPEGRDQVLTPAWLQEGTDGLDVLHRSVEDSVVVSVRNEPPTHTKKKRRNYVETYIGARLSLKHNSIHSDISSEHLSELQMSLEGSSSESQDSTLRKTVRVK